ncbi:MAG: S1C family serine protease [Luteitalea sp.]
MRRVVLPLVLVVGSFVAGMVVTGRVGDSSSADAQTPVTAQSAPIQPKASLLPSTTLPDLADVAERIIPSVVNISAQGSVRQRVAPWFFDEGFGYRTVPTQSAGSGVVIGRDGLILTNAHVVGNAGRLTVILSDRRERDAELIGLDPYTDLALLRIQERNLQPLAWGDSGRLRVADWVMAVGNPYQLGETVTLGIVSALGRTNAQVSAVAEYIQTDAAINPGNSGGALVNRRGELIGINTWIFSESGGYQGIGFAVPSNLARDVATQLQKSGRVSRGSISGIVQLVPLNPSLARDLELTSTDGALVYRISRTGDAYAAGIRPGDVIVGFNGTALPTADDFQRLMLTTPVGTVATLRVRRAGKEFDVKVPVREAPVQQPQG